MTGQPIIETRSRIKTSNGSRQLMCSDGQVGRSGFADFFSDGPLDKRMERYLFLPGEALDPFERLRAGLEPGRAFII
jgi:hypothetical protein